MYIQIQAVLLLYAARREGGIVVDSGDGVMQVRILKNEQFYINLYIIYNYPLNFFLVYNKNFVEFITNSLGISIIFRFAVGCLQNKSDLKSLSQSV